MTDISASHFWNIYIEKTKTYNIKPGVELWYVKRAESYIKYHQGLKLSYHQPEQIESFFTFKSRQMRLKDWQFRRIVQTIELLFSAMFKSDWTRDFPWQEWSCKWGKNTVIVNIREICALSPFILYLKTNGLS